MLVENATNIFWNMLKNKKEQKDLESLAKNKQGQAIFQNPIDKKEEPMKIIERLPTYTKISILQSLLKEMVSIKERFEDNKKNLLEKIKNNCYEYYKSKIGMKEIYDYCLSNYIENPNDYLLIEDPKEYLKEKYEIFYNIIFLLRNNYDLMLNVIKNCPENSYDQLTDFAVNFFYENAIDSSFNEEELMVLIYLVIEEYIINQLPQFIAENEKNKKKTNQIDVYLKENILYHMLKSLTRKPDVRNFTVSVLSESILKLEGYNDILSIEAKIITNNFLKDNTSSINQSFTFTSKKTDHSIKIPSFDETSTNLSFDFSKNISDIINEDISNLENDEKINLEGTEINPFFAEMI